MGVNIPLTLMED